MTASNTDFMRGISITRMNDISYCLYTHEELSYKERYRYALLHVLTTMPIEEPRNRNMLDSIVNIIEGDYGYGFYFIKEHNQIFMKLRYDNLTFDEVETVRLVIQDLDNLKRCYEKEKI